MKTYTYPKNVETMARAGKVIPAGVYGHLGPAEGCMIPSSAYPFFVDHAKGSEMWDVDGNRFIDFMCGYGPNVTGYCDDDVDAAAMKQIKIGNCTSIPSHIMVDFAELLTATVKMPAATPACTPIGAFSTTIASLTDTPAFTSPIR